MNTLVDLALRAAIWGLSRLSDDGLRAGSRMLFNKSWQRFEEAVANPRQVQEARLLAILSRSKDTVFGRENNFEKIGSYQAYCDQVPIRTYDDFEPYIERMLTGEEGVLIPDRPFLFGRSSGTTGTPKYIPITPMYLSEFRMPRRVFSRQVMQSFPGLIRGRFLSVQSPKIEGQTEGGTPYGSITVAMSGKPGQLEAARRRAPWDAAPRTAYLLDDFELKYYAILRLAAQEEITLAATMNPSTLVLLAQKLDAFAEELASDLETGRLGRLDQIPEPIRTDVRLCLQKNTAAARRIRDSKAKNGYVVATDLWPNLAGLICWKGGSAPFYLSQLERWFPGRQAMDFGYLASEGGFSIPISPDGAKGVVAVTGHVLEFVPSEEMESGHLEHFLLADELDEGAEYRVLITGSHGLYRYDINDVVRCVGHYGKTAEIAFVHKGGNMLSITGEKIGESHVVEATRRAASEAAIDLNGFCVACELCDPPRYIFAVEPKKEGLDNEGAERLLSALEKGLRRVNMEYDAKRESLRLGAPKLCLLETGAFERERARRVADGAPDSHVKPPHLTRDPALIDRLGILSSYTSERASKEDLHAD